MSDYKDHVWRYLHNELPTEDRKKFEQALANNNDLQITLNECKTLHQDLELLSNKMLEEKLLAEWESEHPEYQKNSPPIKRGIIPVILSIAATAAIVLFIALPLHHGSINWQSTTYGSLQERGESEVNSAYSQASLKSINNELQRKIEENLSKKSEHWKLKINIQELANGYFVVEISGNPRNTPNQSKTWQETFNGMGHFSSTSDFFAKRVASDIAEAKR